MCSLRTLSRLHVIKHDEVGWIYVQLLLRSSLVYVKKCDLKHLGLTEMKEKISISNALLVFFSFWL